MKEEKKQSGRPKSSDPVIERRVYLRQSVVNGYTAEQLSGFVANGIAGISPAHETGNGIVSYAHTTTQEPIVYAGNTPVAPIPYAGETRIKELEDRCALLQTELDKRTAPVASDYTPIEQAFAASMIAKRRKTKNIIQFDSRALSMV